MLNQSDAYDIELVSVVLLGVVAILVLALSVCLATYVTRQLQSGAPLRIEDMAILPSLVDLNKLGRPQSDMKTRGARFGFGKV